MHKQFTLLLLLLTILYASPLEYEFPYELSLRRDIPLGSSAILLRVTSGIVKKQQPDPTESYILSLDTADIPGFDRRAIYHWSPKSSDASDFFTNASGLSPLLYTIPLALNRDFKEIGTISLMYLEATLFIRSITGLTKYTVRRPRPYLYSSEITMHDKLREGSNATRSFFSGHTSNAFCGAVFTATVFNDLYPDSRLKPLVWSLSLGAATTTGILRYYAGKHYPSDIIVGALAGSMVGYLIPRLHRRKSERFSLALTGGVRSEIALRLHF